MSTPSPSPGDLVHYFVPGSNVLLFGIYLRDLATAELSFLNVNGPAGYCWEPVPGGLGVGGLTPQIAISPGAYTGVDVVPWVNITGLVNANHTDEFFLTNLLA